MELDCWYSVLTLIGVRKVVELQLIERWHIWFLRPMASGCGTHWLPNLTPVLTAKRRDLTNSAILVGCTGSIARVNSHSNVWWYSIWKRTPSFWISIRQISLTVPSLVQSIFLILRIIETKIIKQNNFWYLKLILWLSVSFF